MLNLLFRKKIKQRLLSTYGPYIEKLGVSVTFVTKGFPHPTASGMYDEETHTIYVNLSSPALKHHRYDVIHYIVAMAHELGHASDSRLRHQGYGSPYRMQIGNHRKQALLSLETTAYQLGLQYIPASYRDAYIEKNEAYLSKLRHNPLFMQG